MKIGRLIWALTCGMVVSVFGQMTNVRTETHSIRLEWKAIPGNPYYVFSTPDMIGSGWSNRTPGCVVFADAQGSSLFSMDEPHAFYCVAASNDYLVVDLSDGPDATSYPVSHLSYMPLGGWGDEYKTTKLVLRRIPAGTFTMGSPTNELFRDDDETLHAVTLTKGFYVGVFEVTQKQWERVMGDWPSYITNIVYRDSRPVENVSYDSIRGMTAGANWPADGNVDADSFMGRLRVRTGQNFDLPTESQWEYACRAGTTTPLNSGSSLTNSVVDDMAAVVARYGYNWGSGFSRNGDTSTASATVGSYLPNAWGLYDMHGNVFEWCLDWHGDYPETATDPVGATADVVRMTRGTGFWSVARGCRSADRTWQYPYQYGMALGFRLAGTLP